MLSGNNFFEYVRCLLWHGFNEFITMLILNEYNLRIYLSLE